MKKNNIEDIYPLSPLQNGFLFHEILNPKSDIYFSQSHFDLIGDLNIEAFERAFQDMINYHSIFRSAFIWQEAKEPLQIVYKSVKAPFIQYDWRMIDENEIDKKINDFLISDRKQGFNIKKPPLIRCSIIKQSDHINKILFSFHHIILDGWSMPIFYSQLMELYYAYSSGQKVTLEHSYPFRSYIEWILKQDKKSGKKFWQNYLNDFDSTTILGSTRSINEFHKLDKKYKEVDFVIPVDTTNKLKEITKNNKLTLNIVLQGVLSLFLHKYTGKNDVVFGAVVSGRPPEIHGIEKMIGLFINTLPVRSSIKGDENCLQWYKELHAQNNTINQYSYCSLTEIAHWNGLNNKGPLFDILYIFENYPIKKTETEVDESKSFNSEKTIEVQNINNFERNNFPLTFCVVPGEKISIKITYDTGSIHSSIVFRMEKYFKQLIKEISDDPGKRLFEYSLITKEEMNDLIVKQNKTCIEYPFEKCVHELFEEQVEKTPDTIALVSGDHKISYCELNRRSNQIANYLRVSGVGPEVRVGICVERSIEMIMGVLGILKAGGAYVPIDPSYPDKRIEYILEDSQISTLLTTEKLIPRLPDTDAKKIILDDGWNDISRMSCRNLYKWTTSSNLAYVIYTSGSTGNPKGVQITHKSLINFLNSMRIAPGIKSDDVLLSVTTLSFDIAALEIYLPLVTGARVVILNNGFISDGQYLVDKIEKNNTTIMQATPATWRILLVLEWKGNPHLKILCGGEALPKPLANKLLEKSGEAWNLYGPTETTIWSTVLQIRNAKDKTKSYDGPTESIGKPIDNTQIYLLDQYYQPVTNGVAGLMYIGGEGLARNYFRRPELTAEKFVPNPYASSPGERMYMTGDLARYLETGNIEYLNRIDNQVKIRGHRIELGEIENIILDYPIVKEVIVVVHGDQLNEKRLVAYVVTTGNKPFKANEMRKYLKDKLPEYMVPSIYMALEKMPLTPNKKIDRKKLPVPEKSGLEKEYVPPRNNTEERLVEIWKDVLGIERVGIHDNFFELGGDSLLATLVKTRIDKMFSIEIALHTLFEAQTIEKLSKRIKEVQTGGTSELPIIERVPRDRKLPLSFAQERLWFLDKLNPGNPFYNISIGLKVNSDIYIPSMSMALQEIVSRHEILRTKYITIDGEPIQVIDDSIPDLLSIIDLSHLNERDKESESRRVSDEESQLPFDLENDLMLRSRILLLGKDKDVFLMTMHHISSDGWSMGIMQNEIMELYDAFSKGKPSPLPVLPIQYADFSVWQRDWMSGEILDRQLSYWKKQLAGITPLEIPTDYTRPMVQRHLGNSQGFTIDNDVTEKLREISLEGEVSMYMVLFAVMSILMSRYCGCEDIAIGSSIANRNRKEIEGLIGFFVNTLIIRTDLSGNPTFKELLKRVSENALAAYDNQDLPFEYLVDELKPDRDMGRNPLVQIGFSFQNGLDHEESKFKNTYYTPLNSEIKIAKNDLTIEIIHNKDGLAGSIIYNTDLFNMSTISKMIGYYKQLIKEISENHEKRISEYSLLNEEEIYDIVVRSNKTDVEYPNDKCLHQLFEEQVEKTPDAMAVILEDNQLSYKELNTRANQLAHYLRSVGITSGDRVGLYMQRSIELLISILGVLKAGGAYIPLDTSFPQKRISYMLSDSQAEVLITKEKYIDSLPECKSTKVICMDTIRGGIADKDVENPQNETFPENLAYIIYTSGTTGKSKGVMVTHRGLVNYTNWASEKFDVKSGHGSIIHSSLCFDLPITGLFPPLLTGRRLILLKEGDTAKELVYVLKRERDLSLIKLTPSHLKLFEQLLPSDMVSGLTRRLVVGGEKLEAEVLEFWKKYAPEIKITNHYGPSETVVGCCSYEVSSGSTNSSIPIGRPISNMRLYILNASMNPTPLGAFGELFVGGVQVGRGYLNRPELTAEKYIPNPFDNIPGSRIYKTGDLVQHLSDGNIEYIDRMDNQVKIRGYRMELGEIESEISMHPDVKEVVVIAREDIPGEKRLVAYILSLTGEILDIHGVRDFLKEKLPGYMIPTSFVLLDKMPLTPNGKLDRKGLPSPEMSGLEKEFIAPRNEEEEMIAEIWKEVLGIKKIGIHDNFFEIGGDSMLSLKVVSRAREIGIKITPQQMFQNQTISTLAISAKKVVIVNKDEDKATGPVPLTPAEHYFFEKDIIEYHHFNVPAMFDVPFNIKGNILHEITKALLEHHDILRSKYIFNGMEWSHQISEPDEPVPFCEIDMSEICQNKADEIVEETLNEIHMSLNLADGPLFRVVLFRYGLHKSPELLVVMHHLLSDAISFSILLEDIYKGYKQLSTGERISFGEKTTSFKKWAEYLNIYAQKEKVTKELDFWKEKYKEKLPDIPTDYQIKNKSSHSTKFIMEITDSLDRDMTGNMVNKIPGVYNTQIYDVLLTAAAKTISQFTDSRRVMLNVPRHGRENIFNDVDLSRTMGWFSTHHPVMIKLPESGNSGDDLKVVRDTFRNIPNNGIGFGLLKYLNKDPSVREFFRTIPQTKVSFNFLGQHAKSKEMENILFVPTKRKDCGKVYSDTYNQNLLLSFSGHITDERFFITLAYNKNLYSRETIEKLLYNFKNNLENIILHCMSKSADNFQYNRNKTDEVLHAVNM